MSHKFYFIVIPFLIPWIDSSVESYTSFCELSDFDPAHPHFGLYFVCDCVWLCLVFKMLKGGEDGPAGRQDGAPGDKGQYTLTTTALHFNSD